MSGITRRTLQYYDDEGILPVERTKENYRLYDEKALRKLWEILIYKEIGLSIEQIKQLFEPGGKAQAEILEKQIQAMHGYKAALSVEMALPEQFYPDVAVNLDRSIPLSSYTRCGGNLVEAGDVAAAMRRIISAQEGR